MCYWPSELYLYEDVFGWKTTDMPEMNYTMAYSVEVDEQYMPKKKGAINGGMYQRDEQSAQSPVVVIDVPDLDAHLEKIEAAGGVVVRPKVQVGDIGLYAQVKDTEGNIIGVWQALTKE